MSGSRSQVVSSQGLDPEWKAIPLEKFSSAVSPLGATSHHWVHDVRKDDLFLVFRPDKIPCGGDTFETRLMMTISAGVEILERQDVGKLVTVAEEFDHLLRQGLIDRTLESPVHVVVKLPCIALRYPASQTMVRRIQMRFKTEPDYHGALEFLKELKLPMRSAGSKEPSATTLRQLRPAPREFAQNTSGPSLTRPYTTSASSHLNPSCFTKPLSYLPLESPFFKRPNSTGSQTKNADSVLLPGGMKPVKPPSSMALMQQPFGPTLGPAINWSASSNLGSQQNKEPHMPAAIVPTRNSEQTGYAVSYNANRNAFSPVNLPVSELFGPPQSSSQAFEVPSAIPASRYDFGHFSSATSAYVPGISPRNEDEVLLERFPPLLSETLRPMSAPVHNIYNLGSPSLPPRRELPFPKARGAAKSCTPTNEFSVLPQLEHVSNARRNADDVQNVTPAASTPDPKWILRMSQKPNAVIAMQIPQDTSLDSYIRQYQQDERSRGIVPRMEEPSPLAARSRNAIRPATAPGIRSKAAATANRKRPNDLPEQIASVNKQIKRTVDKGTQTQTLSGRDHTAPVSLSMTSDRPIVIPTNEARTQSPPLNFMNHIDEFVSKYKNRAPPQELWVMPGYTEATAGERQAIINDFICDNLDSEEFLQLCEDTGDVWRRIGLEM